MCILGHSCNALEVYNSAFSAFTSCLYRASKSVRHDKSGHSLVLPDMITALHMYVALYVPKTMEKLFKNSYGHLASHIFLLSL